MPDLVAFLKAQGRDRFIPGDKLSPRLERELFELVRQHRIALELPVVGYGPITAADANAALDWKKAQEQ